MKKAVILSGSAQYIVSEGDSIDVDLLSSEKKSLTFDPLLIIDGANIKVGTPNTSGKVTAEVTSADTKGEKVTAIRYKAKKRVHKVRGHRQRFTTLKITKIS
jgi:large subunit ribosomal protein L21